MSYPERYEILPAPLERVIDVAQRLGRFLAPQHTELCLTTHHPRGAEEMLASIQPTLPMDYPDEPSAR